MNRFVEQYSPDKNFKLTFYDFEEPRMGMDICKFSLTNLQTNEIIEFAPLWALGNGQWGFSWNEDQKIFSLPVANATDNFFIYNIENKQFASIRFENCGVLDGYCRNDYIEIEWEESIEGENLKYPTREFIKPTNIKCNFSELQWRDIKYLKQFDELNKNVAIQEFKPIDKGWRLFKGQLPQTTETLIWELKKFAEYGDKQSAEWLAEIQKMTNKIDYWVNASYYLGLKARN